VSSREHRIGSFRLALRRGASDSLSWHRCRLGFGVAAHAEHPRSPLCGTQPALVGRGGSVTTHCHAMTRLPWELTREYQCDYRRRSLHPAPAAPTARALGGTLLTTRPTPEHDPVAPRSRRPSPPQPARWRGGAGHLLPFPDGDRKGRAHHSWSFAASPRLTNPSITGARRASPNVNETVDVDTAGSAIPP